ncbi:DegV family protein [Erysipelotrichaceae bacterium OttesenSCG-928-M19]|nr:DegV family protein [Erysipelotrichaceae bacterium OttesenSCG-928-M19]
MEKIAYVMDSSCFLDEKTVREMDIFFIPLHIIIEGEDYLEGKNLDKDFLLEAIKNKKNVTTSQPSPGEIIEFVEMLKQEGYTCAIFSSIGSALSNTLENTVSLAAAEGFKIYPVDSKSVGNAQTIPLLKIRREIESNNKSIEEAIAFVQDDINSSQTFLLVEDLFHLSRGGRITAAAAALGTMLKIKPILSVAAANNGQIDVYEKVRTAKKASKRMAEIAIENYDPDKHVILIAYFGGQKKMMEVKKELLALDNNLVLEEYELTTVIGVHTGLESVGIQICSKL